MRHYFRLFPALLISLLLVSCATTEKPVWDENMADETGIYKFAAWRPDDSRQLEAINVLLQEADALIAEQQLDAASDKLERVLRIKPNYAPAWSRLSWLALQMKSPEKAVQMAKRSNSFAHEDTQLQSLNESFIRAASKALNDERAKQNTDTLKVF